MQDDRIRGMVGVSRDGDGVAGVAFVPVTALRNPHMSPWGGRRRVLSEPRLAVYADCAEVVVPAGSAFEHSCEHGPPPHSLLLFVEREATGRELYRGLRGLAAASVLRRTASGGKRMRGARRQQRDAEQWAAGMVGVREEAVS